VPDSLQTGLTRVQYVMVGGSRRVRRHPLAPEQARLLGSDAETELEAHRLAVQAGLAPAIIAVEPSGRWLDMEAVVGNTLPNGWLETRSGCHQLLGVLAQLGAIRCEQLPTVCVSSRCRELHAHLAERDAARARRTETRVKALAAQSFGMSDGLAAAGLVADRLVHGDLHAQNVLIRPEAGRWCLLDWEYAHRGHALEDLAGVLADHPDQLAALEQGRGELAIALREADWSISMVQLRAAVALRSLLNELWTDLYTLLQIPPTVLE
jgi:aminoglycoside phosphotransferase (APT) family kinase protein